MKFLLLVAFALIAVANCRVAHKFSDANCYIRYLKTAGKLDAEFPEFTEVEAIEGEVNCDEVVAESKKEFYDEDEVAIRRDYKGTDEFYTCMVSEIKTRNLSDEFLKLKIFLADEKLTPEEKVKSEAGKNEGSAIKMASIVACHGEKIVVEKLVNSAFTYGPQLVTKDETLALAEYCKRKFVVDNALVDTTVYNVILNPTNVEVTDVNCEEVLTKHDEAVKQKVVDHVGDSFQCMRFKTEGTVDKGVYWKLFTLATMSDISEEHKKTETDNFVEIFSKVDFPIFYSCL